MKPKGPYFPCNLVPSICIASVSYTHLLAYVSGELFEQYIHDMKSVQHFAMLNRQAMMDEIVKGMKLHVEEQFTTIHNLSLIPIFIQAVPLRAITMERATVPTILPMLTTTPSASSAQSGITPMSSKMKPTCSSP